MQPTNQLTGMRAFFVVWFGQFASIMGTSMTQFALTIWSWRFVTEIQPADNPATAMALVGLFNFLPLVLFSPIAGALVDRWNRKLVMMLSDLGAGVATIAIFLLYSSGSLTIVHLYIAGAFTSVFAAFQWPAQSAVISTILPKAQYTRANALMGLVESVPGIFAPIFAPLLLTVIGLEGVLLVDIISFTFAVGSVLLIYIPQPLRSAEGEAGRGSLLKESAYGFQYIWQRKPLLGLQLVFLGSNFLHNLSFALLAAMILARSGSDQAVLGATQAAAGAGGIIGGIVISAWGGFKRRVHGVLLGWIISSLFGTVLYGLGQHVIVWMVAGFAGSLLVPLINGSNQAIWQAKVPPDVQGRVFSARRMIAWLIIPISMAIAGPLADRIFEPGMREGGALAGTFGGLVGTGPGAGMALMFVIFGLMTALVGVIGYLVPVVRDAESLLPDHDMQPQPAPEAALAAEAPAGAV